MPSGARPTGTVLVTVPLAGSIRVTVLSPWLATQTPLGPLAMATGTLPTGICCTTAPAAALIRHTVPSPLLATHTLPPGVTVTAVGAEPTGICCTTAWVTGLMRDSVFVVLLTAHMAPSPEASPSGLPRVTGAPTRPPPESISPTLLAGSPACSWAHGRATTTMDVTPATASTRPRTSRRGTRERLRT